MNLYVLSVILFSMLLVPVSFAGAVTFLESPIVDYKGPPVYVFAQVIHKDPNGNLLALIQSDKMTDVNSRAVNYYMDVESSARELQDFSFDGRTVQVFSERMTNIIDHYDLTASTLLVVSVPTERTEDSNADPTEFEFEKVLTARFAHDGLLLSPGDTVHTTWYLARIL
jgi:hypothetical protein